MLLFNSRPYFMRERDFIQSIVKRTQPTNALLEKGIGDDCAIFHSTTSDDWLISADMLVEGVHFDSSWHVPYLLGRKSLAVNLSDIAAMGGTPQFVLLCLALPGKCDESWTSAFMEGFFSLLNEHECTLIGGDTVFSDKLTISVTVIGRAPKGRAVGRSGAQAGDTVYVSGPLGSAAGGLYLLQNETEKLTSYVDEFPALVQEHLNPSPQVVLGRILQESGMITAMQDISDGIATDLSHIATASSVAATLFEKKLPAHDQLLAMCAQLQLDLTNFQLRGGEDYQLLFTVKDGLGEQLEDLVQTVSGKKIYQVGVISEGKGVTLTDQSGATVNIAYQGYEHCS